MKIVDHTFDSPEENLRYDEALLDACETGNGGPALRFWEPSVYFVVLGIGNDADKEACVSECRRDQIAILRRCSGGGAVLQGPGCLNYALVLEMGSLTRTIRATNEMIMKKNRDIVRNLTGQDVTFCGQTDLAINGRKFSGNSQRRKRNFLLFHGTFLLNFDIKKMERYLAMPSKAPDYRNGRSHCDFVMNLNVPSWGIKDAMIHEWRSNKGG